MGLGKEPDVKSHCDPRHANCLLNQLAADDSTGNARSATNGDLEAGIACSLCAVCGQSPDGLESVADGIGKQLAMVHAEKHLEQIDINLHQLMDGQAAVAPVNSGADAEGSLSQVGDYRLLREIGRGGMGVVYEAQQISLGRRVAVKVLPQSIFHNETASARFEREASAAAKLHHTNIVPVFDSGSEQGISFYAMQLIQGHPLNVVRDEIRESRSHTKIATKKNAETINEAAPSPATADRLPEQSEEIKLPDYARNNYFHFVADIGQQVASALQHAHDRDIVHRDVKPSNLILDEDGVVWLADFGLAKHSDDGLTGTAQAPGTLRYMSPERFQGTAEPVGDVYSLGATLYEMLTLEPAFDADDPLEMIEKIKTTQPKTIKANNASAPLDLQTIVFKAMEKDPQRRYATAAAMADDLNRFSTGRPILARQVGAVERLLLWAKNNRMVAAMAASMTVGLIAVAVASTVGFINYRSLAEAESQRATELELVSDFQASQLAEIDVEKMGLNLRNGLLEETRRALKRTKLDEQEMESHIKELDQQLASTNFTNLAIDTLEANVFERALTSIKDDFKEQPIVQATLFRTVGKSMQELGLLDVALEPTEQALEIFRAELGNEHPDTLTSIGVMGRLLQSQGKLSDAELLLQEALSTRRRLLGDEDPETLKAMNDLGTLRRDQGMLIEAESYLTEALSGMRGIMGNEHPETLNVSNSLAIILYELGKRSESEALRKEVLSTRRRVLGDKHPDTLVSINNVGKLLDEDGKLVEAEPLLQEALAGFRRLLGDEHPTTLTVMGNLGDLLRKRGNLADAEKLLREALAGYRRVLGDEHPETVDCIGGLATGLYEAGKLAEAEALRREQLATSRRILGNDAPDTLASMNSLGSILFVRKKLPKAATVYEEALSNRRRVLGEKHPDTLYSMHNLGRVFLGLGEAAKAESLFREALAGRRSALGNDHQDTLASINILAKELARKGELAESSTLYEEELSTKRRTLGNEHPDTLMSMNNLATMLYAGGKREEAEKMLHETLAGRRRVLGDEDPDTFHTLNMLAMVVEVRGKLADAAMLYQEAIAIRRRTLGDEHPDTLRAMAVYGNTLLKQKRYADAEPILRECYEGRKKVLDKGDWVIGITESSLGQAFAGQQQFAKAEPLLVEGFEKIKMAKVASPAVPVRKAEAGQRIVDLYLAWHAAEPGQGYDNKAAEWQAMLER